MSEVKLKQYAGDLIATTLAVKFSDYDALAAQHDEGLARELALNHEILDLKQQAHDLQQRLAEAEKLLKVITSGVVHEAYNAVNDAKQFLASPGCADGENK